MLEAFPPRDRGKAMAFWGLGVVVAPMLGPVLGGWLTDSYSWRWVFYINIPVGVASVIMTKMFIFDPPYIRRTSSRIDYWGMGFLALGIGALQIVLDKGQEEDWFGSSFIILLVVLCAAGLTAFIARELLTRSPVVQLRVFKNRTYAAGVSLMTILGFVLYGSMVLIPILLQTLLGYPALEAGIAMFPRGLGSFVAMPIVGAIMNRFDPRKLLGLGLLGASYTLFQLSWLNLNAGYWNIFWPQFIQGCSMALVFVPLTTATMDPIRKEEMGNATSIFNLMRNMGGSIGIANATTYLFRREQMHVNLLGANVNAYNPASRSVLDGVRGGFFGQGQDPATAMRQAYGVVYGMVQRQATMLSFNDTFRLLGIVFLLLLPLLLLMKRPASRGGGIAAH